MFGSYEIEKKNGTKVRKGGRLKWCMIFCLPSFKSLNENYSLVTSIQIIMVWELQNKIQTYTKIFYSAYRR